MDSLEDAVEKEADDLAKLDSREVTTTSALCAWAPEDRERHPMQTLQIHASVHV